MILETSFSARIQESQRAEIAAATKLRSDAKQLRDRVARGSYNDDDLQLFWLLTSSTNIVLRVSNTELAEQAGLGSQFFSTVAKDRRRPKLQNFLRALNAIIKVADDRLFDIDRKLTTSAPSGQHRPGVPQQVALRQLATSLALLARDEIEALDRERPNHPEAIAKNKKTRDLLLIFVEGFERIAEVLLDGDDQKSKKRIARVLGGIGTKLENWWRSNGDSAVDWGIRVPVMAAALATLGWAGADMGVATITIAGLVGGDKVMNAIKSKKSDD